MNLSQHEADALALVEKHGGIRPASRASGINYSTLHGRLARAKQQKRMVEPEPPQSFPHVHIKQQIETGLCIYDTHFPYEDDEALALAKDYALSKHKLARVILGGDIADCHKISRFRKDPFSMPFHEEIEYTVNSLEAWLEGMPAERYFIKGNHEDRMQSYLWGQAPEIARLKGMTIPEQLELDRLGLKWVDNLKMKSEGFGFFKIGHLFILHGHEYGICPRINPARQYFQRALHNVMVGHIHKPDIHRVNTIKDEKLGAWSVGCSCDMHPQYRPQNDWISGFALVHWTPDGWFDVELKDIIDGRVM
jgi:UDP-2,3-diacylglucosamine pyrophosphatase LpxH